MPRVRKLPPTEADQSTLEQAALPLPANDATQTGAEADLAFEREL